MKRLILFALLAWSSFQARSANIAVYDQVPALANQTGYVLTSSWLAAGGFGSDADFYVYDSFVLNSDQAITELDWRGGGGTVSNFTVTFFDSIAGGWEPLVTNPQLPETFLAKYTTADNAVETPAGTFGGVPLFNYHFVLPTPFQAAAGHKYWVRVEGAQYTYPPLWGMALGTGGDGQHFTFSIGMARFYFSGGDAAFTLYTLAGPLNRITATSSPVNGGSLSGAGVYPAGLSATLIARPNTNFVFINWTENGVPVSTAATYTFLPTTNRTLVANFGPAFSITTSAQPTSGGSTAGDGSYTYGSSVTVSASANANYAFVNWTEGGVPVSVARNYTFIASANRALVANFVPATVNIAPVFSQPHNTSSGVLWKSAWYPPDGLDGDQYEWDNFSVSSNSAITEIHWRGGYSYGASHAPVLDFTIGICPSIAAGIQPDITAPPIVQYTVGGNAQETLAGTFGGTVMYDYKYVLPTSFHPVSGSNYWVQIEASQGLNGAAWPPDWGLAVGTGGNNSHFYEIIGGSGGGGNLYATGGSDMAFTLLGGGSGYSITTLASPTNGGTLSGSGVYASGASVTVTASPAAGYVFVNWNENGAPVSASSNYTFTATTNRALVANFGIQYSVTTSASPAGAGSTTGDGTYLGGADVSVSATPTSGFAFVGWTEGGLVVSTAPTYYFTADANRALVANFAPLFTIMTQVSPASSGVVSGGGSYVSGATVMLVPTPQPGFAFVSWTEGGSLVCNSSAYSFTADSNRTITANFAPAWTVTTTTASTNGMAVGAGTYPAGTNVTVWAVPRTGFVLSNWTESASVVSLSSAYSFPVLTNRALLANFTPDVTSVTFDFDTGTPGVTNGQSLPFAQTSGGLTAQFSSAAGPAFAIQTDATTGYRLSKFAGNYLYPVAPGAPLQIQLNRPVVSATLSFATLDFQPIVTPSIVRLTAYQNSTNAAPVSSVSAQGFFNGADPMPIGVMTLNATQPFNLLTLEVPGGLTGFAVDSISVSTIPALLISQTPTNTAVLSWLAPSPSFELQQTFGLMPANWVAATNPVQTVDSTNNQIILSPTGSSAFFRLFHP